MRFGPIRRALASSGALLLGVSCLLTAAKPAAAASPPPWRFYNVVDARQAIVPGGTLGRVLTCPDGYRPVGGGVAPTKARPEPPLRQGLSHVHGPAEPQLSHRPAQLGRTRRA